VCVQVLRVSSRRSSGEAPPSRECQQAVAVADKLFWTIANFTLNRKEEPSPLAGRQFPRNSVLGVGDEILKRRENANYAYVLLARYNRDPRPIRIESGACQPRPDDLFLRAGEQGNLASRPRFPQPDGAIL